MNFDIIKIEDIEVGKRARKQFVNIDQLVKSIEKEGLITPIAISKEKNENGKYWLIAGERRLRAFKELNKKEIPAVFVDASDELERKRKELDENKIREDFSWEEAYKLAKEIEELEAIQGKIRMQDMAQSTLSNNSGFVKFDKPTMIHSRNKASNSIGISSGNYHNLSLIMQNKNKYDPKLFEEWSKNRGSINEMANQLYLMQIEEENKDILISTTLNEWKNKEITTNQAVKKIKERKKYLEEDQKRKELQEKANEIRKEFIKNSENKTDEELKNLSNELDEVYKKLETKTKVLEERDSLYNDLLVAKDKEIEEQLNKKKKELELKDNSIKALSEKIKSLEETMENKDSETKEKYKDAMNKLNKLKEKYKSEKEDIEERKEIYNREYSKYRQALEENKKLKYLKEKETQINEFMENWNNLLKGGDDYVNQLGDMHDLSYLVKCYTNYIMDIRDVVLSGVIYKANHHDKVVENLKIMGKSLINIGDLIIKQAENKDTTKERFDVEEGNIINIRNFK
ncbi:MAG: ParB/RepB/Spo0J family partition protein [Tissierellia bacterium]|nr:ParB/RepB/Spo0J family partition protein [Tissierellia bacterium]